VFKLSIYQYHFYTRIFYYSHPVTLQKQQYDSKEDFTALHNNAAQCKS